jgi:hypothetical protein
MTNNNITTPIKRIQYLGTKNNLLHHCISDKDWYVHVATLYTLQDLKYRFVVKET